MYDFNTSPVMQAIQDCYVLDGRSKPSIEQIFADFSQHNLLLQINYVLDLLHKDTDQNVYDRHLKILSELYNDLEQLKNEQFPQLLPNIILNKDTLLSDKLDEVFGSTGFKNLCVRFDPNIKPIYAKTFFMLHLQFVVFILQRNPSLMETALLKPSVYCVFSDKPKDRRTLKYCGGYIDVEIESANAIYSMIKWSELTELTIFNIEIHPFDYEYLFREKNRNILQSILEP